MDPNRQVAVHLDPAHWVSDHVDAGRRVAERLNATERILVCPVEDRMVEVQWVVERTGS
ncbi:MAG: hypothetical protein J7M25_11900 [Deltaproteobacteria bacterium]|nr:hypothetical protein [Deltaproteobacteria bacterium]